MERGRTHPILIAAGVAMLLFSLLGAVAGGVAGGLLGNQIVNGSSLERA